MKAESLNTHGRTFTGKVLSTKMSKTISVEWESRRYVPKYERYERRKSRVYAHLPEGAKVEVGDLVKIKETRPLSKTKNFVFVENLSDKKEEKTEIKEIKNEGN